MSKHDKAALAKGAVEIRKAETKAGKIVKGRLALPSGVVPLTCGGLGGTRKEGAGKLDGTLASVVKEITRLHGEIMSAARTSLEKAIRVGELLCRVRSSRKGKWLQWISDNAPFSDKTARNYIHCYQRRGQLKLENVSNLSEAYALLSVPGKTNGSTKRSKTVKPKTTASNNGEAKGVAIPVPELSRLPKPIRNIQPDKLETEAEQGEMEIDAEFTARIGQISRKNHAAWPDFPARLIEHGKELIAQGERLR